MSDFEDIKKQLEVKNKEIYENKLNFDLEHNLEVLVLTIDNLLEKISFNLLKSLLEIKESFQNEDNFQKSIKKFVALYREELINIIEFRKNNLLEEIKTETNLNKYKNFLSNDFEVTKEKIDLVIINSIDELKKDLNIYFDTEFEQKRLSEYLNKILKENLNIKTIDAIKNRDIILMNTFKETYLKYLELNKNTVGV